MTINVRRIFNYQKMKVIKNIDNTKYEKPLLINYDYIGLAQINSKPTLLEEEYI